MGFSTTDNEWFKTIHDNIPVGIFRTTPEGRFLSVNPAMVAMNGYGTAEQLMRVSVADLYWNLEDRSLNLVRLEKEGAISEVEVRLKRRDGSPYWAALTARRGVDADGRVHVDGIVQDISLRKKIEQDLITAHSKLETHVRERTADLSTTNARLRQEIDEKQRLHEDLLISQKNFAKTCVDLEKAILNANQMAADAEVRSYELEMEIERRKKSEAALYESENRYRSIIETIEDGYSELDLTGKFIFCNEAMCRIVGYDWPDLARMKNTDILVPEEKAAVIATFTQVLQSATPPGTHRFTVVRKDGQKRQVEVLMSLIQDARGNRTGFRGIVRDVEERRRYEAQLIHQAHHDALTGLKNRKAFYERLREAITFCSRYRTELTLAYLDLDRFKQVNDTFGHETGDLLLKEIASRLLHHTRKTDLSARLGGDEFAIILNNPKDIQVEVVAKRIVRELSKPYDLNGHRIDFVSASVGTSHFPDDAADPDTLVQCADTAMYRAKKGRNRFVQYGRIQP